MRTTVPPRCVSAKRPAHARRLFISLLLIFSTAAWVRTIGAQQPHNLGFEAGMAEAQRINRYVLTGEGDPAHALAGLGYWTWRTQEVLDLIEWMRAYNSSGRGRIEFWGFDSADPSLPLDSVEAFVERAAPDALAVVRAAYDTIRTTWSKGSSRSGDDLAAWLAAAERVSHHLEQRKAAYLERFDTAAVEWALQNARLVGQAAVYGGTDSPARDRYMAENIHWILQQRPAGTKAVLWAHNEHVRRLQDRMGGELDAIFGDELRVVGFAIGGGEYMTIRSGRMAPFPVHRPAVGSIEEMLDHAGHDRFALDLRAASRCEALNEWLSSPRPFLALGAQYNPYGYLYARVAHDYDLMIYLRNTSPTRVLLHTETASP